VAGQRLGVGCAFQEVVPLTEVTNTALEDAQQLLWCIISIGTGGEDVDEDLNELQRRALKHLAGLMWHAAREAEHRV
jgi:hypothetical protein